VAEWDPVFEHEKSGDGRPVLAVSGEVDLAVAPRFATELATLLDSANGEALVDLSHVGFMDSSGVRELLIANRTADEAGSRLVLVAPSESCRHVLQVSGAWGEFRVEEAS
jgi:anti-sigma B factor antagonist